MRPRYFRGLLVIWALAEAQEHSLQSRLAAAAERGDVAVLRELLDTGRNSVDSNSRVLGTFTPLMIAARWGHDEAVRFLLERGADVNLGNRVLTPLSLATMHGHHSVARLLIQSGSAVNAAGFTGITPLGEAVSGGHTKIVEELLKAGATSIADVRLLRWQPIVLAASQGRTEILKRLLGPDIDASGAVVTAAFINASWHGHSEIVELLLDFDVDPDVTDEYGRSALDAAIGGQHDGVRRLLEQAGASR